MLETAGAPSLSTPAAEVVLRELDRIGGSRSFRRAEQCHRNFRRTHYGRQ